MKFTAETEIGSDLSIVVACLKSIGIKTSYSKERGRFSLLLNGMPTELFLSGVERIEMKEKDITFFLSSGKTITASPGMIQGESMPRPKEEKELLSFPEAAAYIGVDRATLYKWIAAGKMKREGKKIRREEALRAWKESKVLQYYEREREIQERTGVKS